MLKYLSASLCFIATALAANNPDHIGLGNKKAVFVDFISTKSYITYNIQNKKVTARTIINFIQEEEGNPIFDLVEKVQKIKINGKATKEVIVSSPDKVTEYKTISSILEKGSHTLEIFNEISDNVRFEKGGVQSAFWMSDLSDRNYLEQYLPSNIEYDQYQMTFDITFKGNTKPQKIYANGIVKKLKNNHFEVIYPEYFTTSSLYFHTATEGRFEEVTANYKSVSGKTIPVLIYSKNKWNLKTARAQTLKILAELEQKLGAWSHPSFTAYIAGQGGMEHSGATITSMRALGHEITHSFFARGVLPIDGNSGWMDEAIASWRDSGYRSIKKPSFNSSGMANHSQYRRTTDRRAYTQGANFMAYLNYTLANLGGLEKFLHFMHGKYIHTSINTETFRKELEGFSGLNFEADFNKYIYGQEQAQKEAQVENPFHPKLSKEQLRSLL